MDVVEDTIWQLDNLLFLLFESCRNIRMTRFPKRLKTLEFWNCAEIPPIDFSQMPALTSMKFYSAGDRLYRSAGDRFKSTIEMFEVYKLFGFDGHLSFFCSERACH